MHKTKTHCRHFCQKIFHIVCHVYQWIVIMIASQVLLFLMQKRYLQCVCFYRLPVWNKLEAMFTWSSSTLSHVKRVGSAVWSFCVHKKNCKILYGKCVMQFDMLKELQIYETRVRDVTEIFLDTNVMTHFYSSKCSWPKILQIIYIYILSLVLEPLKTGKLTFL